MKIILKGADFSANNIGTTEVPFVPSPTTQAYFDAIPTSAAAMSTTDQQAFNTAINTMVSEGLYSKVSDLYIMLPILDSTERWVNIANPSETLAFPSSGYGSYDTNGFTPTQGWDSGKTLVSESRHVMFYNTTAADPSATNVTFGSGTSFTQWVGRRVGTNVSGYYFDSSNSIVRSGAVDSTGVVIGSNLKSASSLSIVITNAASNESTVALGDTSTDPLIVFSSVGDSNSGLANIAHACIGWGDGLTLAESETYRNIISTLIDAIK